ncbi:3D-(3,5/4)-trihydroxycyclohexane-1,2-dione acylhydrolase (decyclizing) [Zooshikella harenae]|uniref:3D-(3,5/4)-trihydroxycyclohexane-1,2-dione acylhydrolase (Decyclizing) n=1 Tax=Zooshikella harenae TaxID=2827238 RepID=A0ABS5ZCX3_9GAMM|nr:3D-(3,5/4)-trihydroxycyclohexane-1,2-dione acylhydrolase (decyclizing) [Zooshikella harenae]MBU2711181.1 3D-(3,5/4)-trihydroxycyclohexane-1,2-dione acylhydrolase (decyclizing) [Zooshikella harenae]
MKTVRLTMAQALVNYLAAQFIEVEGEANPATATQNNETKPEGIPLFAGVFAIFGHGNVAGLGEALYQAQEKLPTFRAHNEQSMAHAAIAFAKAHRRRRMMACTTSIGPGATNMVTAAAIAHVNRLPVLLLPADTFATRIPDPVLQQVEYFADPTLTANDCFRPVSRYFDRLTRPEQLINSLPTALSVLLDPVNCGPVTLALPQDVQAMSYDYPAHWFTPQMHTIYRPQPDVRQLQETVALLQQSQCPLLVVGGGVHYSEAFSALVTLAEQFQIPIVETQAGKGAVNWEHPCNMGSIGVTGTSVANTLATQADVVLAVGTRLQDFTTGSRTLFNRSDFKLIQLNVNGFDAHKHQAIPLICDARVGLEQLYSALQQSKWQPSAEWAVQAQYYRQQWITQADQVLAAPFAERAESITSRPTQQALGQDCTGISDAQVIGAVQRLADEHTVVVGAAGGLPGELHKLWRAPQPGSYHLEYGYSCMGYEIAGGLGVKLADPQRDVIVMVGDGSYLMLNSEIATSVMMGLKLIIVVLDNQGFGCINRLQQHCGSAPFNNLLADCYSSEAEVLRVNFAAHARSLGAEAEQVSSIHSLEQALTRAKAATRTYVITIDTDPRQSTEAGGCWWDVAVPEVSERHQVNDARAKYEQAKRQQPY